MNAHVVDVYSDEMNALSTPERLAAFAAWQALPKRPAYAYPSSEIARRLGCNTSGCWYVENNPGSVASPGYALKADAYKAAGVAMYQAPAPARHMVNELDAYVGSLRNPEKKDYAARYAIWRVRGGANAEGVPSPQPFQLSTMAAQAVRMEIERIVYSNLPQHCCSCGVSGACNLCGKMHIEHKQCPHEPGKASAYHTADCARAYDLMAVGQ